MNTNSSKRLWLSETRIKWSNRYMKNNNQNLLLTIALMGHSILKLSWHIIFCCDHGNRNNLFIYYIWFTSSGIVELVHRSCQKNQGIHDGHFPHVGGFHVGRFARLPWKAFVSMLVDMGLYNLKNLLVFLLSLLQFWLQTGHVWAHPTLLLSHLRGWTPLWFCSRHLRPI